MLRALALLLFVLASGSPAAAKGPLVLAASSMQEALTDAADLWAASGYGRPVLSFASSAALARQVAAGAPADLFISADAEWMDLVAGNRRIVPGSRAVIATNRLVLVYAPGTPRPAANAEAVMRALGDGRLAIADPDAVPAGRYARQALRSLGLWLPMAGRLARAENVRAALALVERGAAPLGIVYLTDAKASRTARQAALLKQQHHTPIAYHAALLSAGKHPDAAAFLAFLSSPAGQAAFGAHGFGPPS
ncbi:molybdate ABC transporter substrate-binding protein [Pacificimonas sp. WHA3]|uniref:Molybdate ABC transporter substrate-binding protein n=1 Tax=Pacificimonas pallii TaxID=2827236 RepID=A0ABS6SBV2_9SPHN|nr:molybdate ABC transporter substrate-binding protein [Pacificimonas pallii]MBV7255401.1 molybdate ABC transporter substrate-binding protein [Pacificimonas pallii]